jgi:hypothetical protein
MCRLKVSHHNESAEVFDDGYKQLVHKKRCLSLYTKQRRKAMKEKLPQWSDEEITLPHPLFGQPVLSVPPPALEPQWLDEEERTPFYVPAEPPIHRDGGHAVMKTYTAVVTPESAAQWLATNGRNRPIRARHVARLAAAMTRGEWRLNGETIKIGVDGSLLDGQHRLLAIIASGVAVELTVAVDVDPAVFPTIDTGVKRQARDVLAIAGESSCVSLSAAAALCLRFPDMRTYTPNIDVSHASVLAFVRNHPQLEESVAFFATQRAKRLVGSAGIALHYLFRREDRDAADVFFLDLIDGANLQRNQSVFLLRNRLLDQRRSRLREMLKLALFIKAWNRRSTTLEVLQWRSDELFPVIGQQSGNALRYRANRVKARDGA